MQFVFYLILAKYLQKTLHKVCEQKDIRQHTLTHILKSRIHGKIYPSTSVQHLHVNVTELQIHRIKNLANENIFSLLIRYGIDVI